MMKELKSKRMKTLLKSGIRKAKKIDHPSDGFKWRLFDKSLKNGWLYQVDYVFDSRWWNVPYVRVCAYKPPVCNCGCARPSYYLEKAV